MSKPKPISMPNPQHGKAEEFHKKLEKGAKTAVVHRMKVQQNEPNVKATAEPDRGHGHSQAAHLTADSPVKPQAKRPIGDPNAGQHPGALLKR